MTGKTNTKKSRTTILRYLSKKDYHPTRSNVSKQYWNLPENLEKYKEVNEQMEEAIDNPER